MELRVGRSFGIRGVDHPPAWPCRSFEAAEFATLEWVDRFNNLRLLAPIGNIPPTEAEARRYIKLEQSGMAG